MSRTMQVYAWALERRSWVRAIKGSNRPLEGQFYKRGRGWYDPGEGSGEKIECPLWLLDVHHYQDELADLMQRQVAVGVDDAGEPILGPAWMLNHRNDEEYNAHMGNLWKIAEREGTQLVERWRPVTSGARVDYRACEGYGVAGAYMRQIHLLPSLEDFEAMRQAELREEERHREQPRSAGGIRMPDGRDFITTSNR